MIEQEETPEELADGAKEMADQIAEHYKEHIGEEISQAAYGLVFGVAGIGTIFDILIDKYVPDEHKGHVAVGIGLALQQLTNSMETYVVLAEKMRNKFMETEEGKRFKEEVIEEPERRPPGLS